jgi:hypothetical protein
MKKRKEYQNQQRRKSRREMSIKISNGEDEKEKYDKNQQWRR